MFNALNLWWVGIKIAYSTGLCKKLDNAASIEDFPDATTRCEVVELLAFKLDIRGELFTE